MRKAKIRYMLPHLMQQQLSCIHPVYVELGHIAFLKEAPGAGPPACKEPRSQSQHLKLLKVSAAVLATAVDHCGQGNSRTTQADMLLTPTAVCEPQTAVGATGLHPDTSTTPAA